MAILASELVWRQPAVVNDTSTNGGRMTSTSIPSGAKNNIFPDVSQAERTSGAIKYRKVFVHVANDDDLTLQQPKLFVETHTPGDDSVAIFAGTQSDTQATLNDATLYGTGDLNVSLVGAESALDVLVEDDETGTPLVLFRVGDTIRISDKTDVNDVGGNEEFHTVLTASAPVGNVVTLTLDGSTVANAYVNTATRVASLYEPADLASSVDNLVDGSAGGSLNDTLITTDHIATIEQTWTITFTDATNFDVIGDVVGSVGSGTVGSQFAPSNPAYTKPYFTIPTGAWGGTFVASDTFDFDTHPASAPVWYKRMVPAGASSLTGNSVIVAVDGESAA